jgi:hypothetical protein
MTIASYGLSEDYPVHALHLRRESPTQASGRLTSFPTPEQRSMPAVTVSRFKRIRDRVVLGFLYTASGALALAAAYNFLNFPKH